MIELPANWICVSLGELLNSIEAGKSFKCKERPPQFNEVGVVKVSAVTWGRYQELESKTCVDPERINSALFVATGDFLFSRANTIELVGTCVMAENVSRRVMLSDKILRFRFLNDSHKLWTLHFLRSKTGRQQIEELASGNQESMRNIGQEQIRQIQVPLPPPAEQTRIVAKLEELLSDLDAGVTELKAAQKKLALYRQSLLKAAVEGSLTAEWRAKNKPTETGAQLLERILNERRARWEAKQLAKFKEQDKTPPKDWQKKYPEPVQPNISDFPKLPEGWTLASMDQLVFESSYGTSAKCDYQKNGIPVLRIPNVREGKINLQDIKFSITDLSIEKEDHLTIGDILVIRTNGSIDLVGQAAAIIKDLPTPYYFASYLLRLRCTEKTSVHRWLLVALSAQSGRKWLEARAASSAGQHNISLSSLLTMPIPLPPLAEQLSTLNVIEEMQESIKQQETAVELSIKHATAQRQNILRAAFSGQLVPQDPHDEPASVLLERVRAERAAQNPVKTSTSRRRKQPGDAS